MQRIALEAEPVPLRPMNFNGINCTFQATPAMPRPLLPTAPMMPATCEPWPCRSEGSPAAAVERATVVSMPWRSSM